MPFRASDFQQLDYGDAVQTGQQIQYNRLRNQALGIEQQEAEDRRRKQAQADQIRRSMETMPEAIDELESQGLFDQADELRTSYLRQAKGGVEIARMLAKGLNESNYKQVRHDMIQSGAITGDLWPEEYSEDWWAKQIAEKKRTLTQHTVRWQEENGATVAQDLLASDGDIFWKGTPYESAADRKARDGGGDGFEFKASDTNAIGTQVTRLFGGVYDPATGRFAGLDPQKANRAAAVHAAADELYAAGQGGVTHAQAVREAARRLRISIEDPNDSLINDPAGILPQGGQFTPPPQ